MHPTALQQIDASTLGITWNDGSQTQLNVRALRIACPCALCVDEITGVRRLDPKFIPADVRPLRISPVGHYALHIDWSDGHQSGHYRFEQLRALSAMALH